MNIAVFTDGFTDWNGGLDFLKIILRGLKYRKENKIFLFFVNEYERVHRWRFLPISVAKIGESFIPYQKSKTIDMFADFPEEKIVEYQMKNLNQRIKENNIDVVFPSYGNLGRNLCVKWCLQVFDCQHKYFPEFFSPWSRWFRDFYRVKSLSNADAVICNSMTAKKDFELFYSPKTKIFNLPVCPTLNPLMLSDDVSNIGEKYNLKKKYFIISNQFWVHKCHDTAIKALGILSNQGITDVDIVCTGKMDDHRDKEHIEKLKMLVATNNLNDNFRFVGFIPKKDQIELMKHSLGVIQPSQYEGDCSGQVIDAIAVGQRAIVSDIDVCKEVSYIKNITYFKVNDENDLADKMKSFVNTPYQRPSKDELIAQEVKYLQAFSDRMYEVIDYMMS